MCQNNASTGPGQQPQQQPSTTTNTTTKHPQQQNQLAAQVVQQLQQQHLSELGGQQQLQQQLAALVDQQLSQKQPTYHVGQQMTSSVELDQLTNGRVRRLDSGSQSATSSPYPARLRNPLLEQYRLQVSSAIFLLIFCHIHRRRIKTEEKAMVVAAVWGTELIQFLATLHRYFPPG